MTDYRREQLENMARNLATAEEELVALQAAFRRVVGCLDTVHRYLDWQLRQLEQPEAEELVQASPLPEAPRKRKLVAGFSAVDQLAWGAEATPELLARIKRPVQALSVLANRPELIDSLEHLIKKPDDLRILGHIMQVWEQKQPQREIDEWLATEDET